MNTESNGLKMVLKYRTNGYNCYNIEFSPQISQRIGCVSSQNFGIAGHLILDLIKLFSIKLISINFDLIDRKWGSIYIRHN